MILAFSLIMFAYAGSASFPTYQADMEKKSDFPKAVVLAMACKFLARDHDINSLNNKTSVT